ncbi:unnamed protein product [Effrenium voratum]|nr:unnamed protein product [Effrenium voratum]
MVSLMPADSIDEDSDVATGWLKLAELLKQASAALDRVGDASVFSDLHRYKEDKAKIEESATTVAQVAAGLKRGEGAKAAKVAATSTSLIDKLAAIAGGKIASQSDSPGRLIKRKCSESPHSSQRSKSPVEGVAEEDIQEFVTTHALDEWVGEALMMLSPSQRHSVLHPPLNMERARNPNGVVMSRVKQVAPIEERVQMFVKVNDLAEGVVDRLSTLTADQCEAVMDSGLKIQRAANPSGVAMSRISEVLRTMGDRGGRPLHLHPRSDANYRLEIRHKNGGKSRRSRSRKRRRRHAEVDDMPQDVRRLMEELGLEDWCGEVLRRLSLWQRQAVVRELGNMRGVRNPSGVVMSRIKQVATPEELLTIFVDLNSLDRAVEAKLWELTPEQRMEVLAPGIFVQNVRNTSTAVRSRIANVLEGRSAMTRPPRHEPGMDEGPGRERRKHHRSASRQKRRRHGGGSGSSESRRRRR